MAKVGVGRFADGGRWITDGDAQYGQIVASKPDMPVSAAPHDWQAISCSSGWVVISAAGIRNGLGFFQGNGK
jgi:hypothetical protein